MEKVILVGVLIVGIVMIAACVLAIVELRSISSQSSICTKQEKCK